MEHFNDKAKAEAAEILSRLRDHVSITESNITEPTFRVIQHSLEQMYWAGIRDYMKGQGENNAER